MLTDPPPDPRPRHPLEGRPAPPPRQQVMLYIRSVRPYVTYAILAINIVIFLIRAVNPDVDADLFRWGADSPARVLQDRQFYRLLSSMFLHASVFGFGGEYAPANSLHLIFNAYVIYGVGSYIEPLFGHLRFGLIYLLGGLAGSVLSTVMGGVMGNLDTFSVGASGAVFALIGSEFIYLYYHRKLLGANGRTRMQSLVAFSVINLLFGAASSLGLGDIRVDNWAHLGGLAGGLILTWFISPIFVLRRHPDRPGALLGDDINPLKRRSWVLSLYAAGLIALLIFGVSVVR